MVREELSEVRESLSDLSNSVSKLIRSGVSVTLESAESAGDRAVDRAERGVDKTVQTGRDGVRTIVSMPRRVADKIGGTINASARKLGRMLTDDAVMSHADELIKDPDVAVERVIFNDGSITVILGDDADHDTHVEVDGLLETADAAGVEATLVEQGDFDAAAEASA